MIVAIPEPFKTVVTFAHPLLMLLTLFLALYAGYVGWQYRKIRSTEGEEKKALIAKRYNILHHKLGSVFSAVWLLLITIVASYLWAHIC